ncbi:Bcl-2 antagonist/killer [Bulinus truncatus]|nr:Bcl-2 antagonist/killer [Bulinus truncatus]
MAWSQNQETHGLLRTLRAPQIRPVLSPDTEEHVQSETSEVCTNYFYQSYENEINRGEAQDMPVVSELIHLPSQPTQAAEIGRKLAFIGDEINKKYADMFDGMISTLRPTNSEDAYNDFANIGRRVFDSGTTWGNIVVLLSFGYRMALSVLRSRTTEIFSFFSRVASFICRYLISERITKWIAEHGGWRASLSYIPILSSRPFWFVSALQALVIFGIFIRNR